MNGFTEGWVLARWLGHEGMSSPSTCGIFTMKFSMDLRELAHKSGVRSPFDFLSSKWLTGMKGDILYKYTFSHRKTSVLTMYKLIME